MNVRTGAKSDVAPSRRLVAPSPSLGRAPRPGDLGDNGAARGALSRGSNGSAGVVSSRSVAWMTPPRNYVNRARAHAGFT